MKYFFSCLITLFFIACNETKSTVEIQEYDNKKITFYPIKQQLDSQVRSVINTPYFIYHKQIRNGNTDSAVIDNSTFQLLSNEFLSNDISDTAIKKFYKESVFEDLTTKSITINYTTTHPSLPIRSIDILLDDESQRLKRIFINKQFVQGDTTIELKLGWKMNESFFINKSSTPKAGKPLAEQHVVVWNEKNN